VACNSPTSVILTLEDGTNQRFTLPKGQKFNLDGKMVRETLVVEVPETVVQREVSVTGKMTPPPAGTPILVVETTQGPGSYGRAGRQRTADDWNQPASAGGVGAGFPIPFPRFQPARQGGGSNSGGVRLSGRAAGYCFRWFALGRAR
jgi:hypothetical protein